jgi:hypothetical protein
MVPVYDMSQDDWITAYTLGSEAACYPPRDKWVPTTVDNHPAGIAYGGCFNYAEAIVLVDGWAYVFTLEDSSPPADRLLLDAFLSTVTFTAVPAGRGDQQEQQRRPEAR